MKSEEDIQKEAFQKLKPVCDKLIKNLNRDTIRDFRNTVELIPNDALTYLSDYVTFPIQFHLLKLDPSGNYRNGVVVDLLACFKTFLSKTSFDSIEKFVNLNGLMLRLISSENSELVANTSEDLKLEIVSCVFILYESLDNNFALMRKVYDCKSKFNVHAQAIYICTRICRLEKSMKLRLEALKCILAIVRLSDRFFLDITKSDELFDVKRNLVAIVSSMFPGIASACHSVIAFNSTTHRNIFTFGTRILCRCIALLFEDDEIAESNIKGLLAVPSNQTKKSPNSFQTSEWRESTIEKLKIFIDQLVALCNHQHPKVRKEIADGVVLILDKCFRSLHSITASLVHILVILSFDKDEAVKRKSQTSLNSLICGNSYASFQILGNLEENFLETINSTYSVLNIVDDSVLLSRLKLLNGLLMTLDLNRVFNSSVYMDELFNALIHIVRFDTTSMNTFDEHTIKSFLDTSDTDIHSRISWKNMKYLNSNTESALFGILSTISGRLSHVRLAYYLLDSITLNLEDRKELIYIINHVLFPDELESDSQSREISRHIFNFYIDPSVSDLCYGGILNCKSRSLTLNIMRSNLLQVCLLTEGFGLMASSLKAYFKCYLMHCLYVIVERAGSAHALLNTIALESLRKISIASGYSQMTELIRDNIDFIMHPSVLKLRHLVPETRVFDVFCVIIKYSEKDSLAVICDAIQIFLENDKIVSEMYSAGFLRVFNMFVNKVRCFFVPNVKEESSTSDSIDELTSLMEKVCHVDRSQISTVQQCSEWAYNDESVDLQSIFQAVDCNIDENEDFESNVNRMDHKKTEPIANEGDVFEMEQFSDDKKIPQHIQLVISISEHILHVFPHKNTMNKVLIVEILINSLLILHDFGEDELLPTVHKVWGPLVNRFMYDKQEMLLMRRCVELLCVLAATAKDFIKQRTLKSVQPSINQFLLESSKESRLKDKNSVYRTSQIYKLQYTLLKNLAFLVCQTGFYEKDVYCVLEAVTPYLSSKQPQPLQDACVHLLEMIGIQYADFVGYYLLNLYQKRRTFQCKNALDFRTINLNPCSDPAVKEYEANVSYLLNKIVLCRWELIFDDNILVD